MNKIVGYFRNERQLLPIRVGDGSFGGGVKYFADTGYLAVHAPFGKGQVEGGGAWLKRENGSYVPGMRLGVRGNTLASVDGECQVLVRKEPESDDLVAVGFVKVFGRSPDVV